MNPNEISTSVSPSIPLGIHESRAARRSSSICCSGDMSIDECLTFDMSDVCKRAKPACRRPLDGRVSRLHLATGLGIRVALRAALISWSSVLTPLMTKAPPFRQRVRVLASDSELCVFSTRTSMSTSVPPSTMTGMPIISRGPNSRTTTKTTRSALGCDAATKRISHSSDGSGSPAGQRLIPATDRQLVRPRKSSIPRRAAASRSGGSFWSARHCGLQ